MESGVKIETLLQYHHCHIHLYQHHRHYRAILLILIINLSWVDQKRLGSKHSSICGRRRFSFCKKTKQFAAIDALRIRSWLWVHSRFKRQARTIFFNKLVGEKKREIISIIRKECLLEIIKLSVENKKLLRRCGGKGSRHQRKVQFFLTLFKSPLPPPPFRLNIMWWIFLKEF